jgi:hypothetical protein
MPKYLVHRTIGRVSDAELAAGGYASNAALAGMSGIRWIRSYYSAEEGKLYCEYEALDLELLLEHARRGGLAFDGAKIVRELDPDMFR